MRKLTCPSSTEVLGVNIIAYIDNIQGDETKPIAQKYGVFNPQPDQWYKTLSLLDALNEMAQQPNVTFNFVAIGMEIGRICPMPPGMQNPTIEEVLMIWNDLYQGLHRNGDVGLIRVEKESDSHFKTIHTDVYPDDFSYGILYGFAKRFLPAGTSFKVAYDQQQPPRDYGGLGASILHLTWN
jgi:hypothetical protein